ncbi:MAG: nitroreductase family protein [bacterium]
MGLLSVDQNKCASDGICSMVCPTGIIRLQGEPGHPQIVPGGDPMCIGCGHCVAACPHGALDHARVPLASCLPIDPGLAIRENQAVQFLRSRRSIRLYREKPVEREKIRRLIEIARYAPTGSNSQMVAWVVFSDRARIRELSAKTVDWMRQALRDDPQAVSVGYLPLIVAAWDAGIDAVLRNAPVLLVATAPEEATNGLVDLSLALAYLELAAPTLGLGTCWAGVLRRGLLSSPELREAAGIPRGHPYYYPMMMGYPKLSYHRLPERKAPKVRWL